MKAACGRRSLMTGVLAAGLIPPRAVTAAPMSVRQVIAVLRGPRPADLAGRDLSRLDLAELDFHGANLAGASLFGTDLTGARLIGAKLNGCNLDRATIIRADFTDADLSFVSMFLPAASSVLGESPAREAPCFRRANLTGAYVLAKLANGDWTGANLTNAHLEVGRTQFLAPARSDLSGCRMVGANFAGADLSGVRLAFADLRGASLVGARLRGADLAGALLSGADLTGADLGRADLQRASLRGVIGLDRAVDLESARNLDLASR
ncbi:MAG: pentapeptide repeat-containing protein [Gemmatimonadaceae bacterium]|nr:pentapeptide repeat-containing protein [Acetobacteraceae bacterium]